MRAHAEPASQPSAPSLPWESRLRVWHLLVLAALPVACSYAEVLPALSRPAWLGGVFFSAMLMVWVGIACFALCYGVAVPFLLIWSTFPRLSRRQRVIRVALACALFGAITAMWSSVRPAGRLRLDLIRGAPSRLEPLVSALERYHGQHGTYPATLDGLVPRYLPRIPETGMVGYRKLEYKRIDQQPDWRKRPMRAGPEFELSISCSSGFANFDSLHYWPSERYPERKWGGVIERMDGWAYVHE